MVLLISTRVKHESYMVNNFINYKVGSMVFNALRRLMDKYLQCIERIVEIRKTVLSSFTVNM